MSTDSSSTAPTEALPSLTAALQVIDPKAPRTLRVATVNVNGIRAAVRKGMAKWLAARQVDVLALQEVRAPDKILRELLAEINDDPRTEWNVLHAEAEAKGRAGVAIATKLPILAAREHIGEDYFATSGRWVEADVQTPDGKTLTIVSAYVHSGEAGTPKQDDKYRFMDVMIQRLPAIAKHADYGLVVGDLNVGHTTLDIKNWKGNVKRAGFLPEERAYFDRFFGDECGWTDVARKLAGEVDGPYTWWSWRGKAFDNDTGWRIDYHAATPELAAKATKSVVDRAPSYDTRFSDHAPLVVDYQF